MLLLESKLDVLAITETHLKGDINSSEILLMAIKLPGSTERIRVVADV